MPVDELPVPGRVRDQIQDIALRVDDMLYDADVPPFDRVRWCTAERELWFIWEARKAVVIVELNEDLAPTQTLDAMLAQVLAQAGDPVLN